MPLALLGALFLSQAPLSVADGVPLRVLTFNIRYDEPADGLDAWPLRRDDVAGILRFHRPDVAGLQEVLTHQLDELLERLSGYAAFGEGRDGGRSGEHCPILYRPERLELLEQGTFWLSDTPERPGAAWGASLSRICTWGTFRDRTSGEPFSVWNVHLDHRSQEAREKSAELLGMLIGELAPSEPAVLLGDFNCGEESQAYATLVAQRGAQAALSLFDAGYVAREPGHGPSVTYTGFGRGEIAGARIDHVFVRGPLRVERHAVLADYRDGRTPSDHRPVLADLTLGVPFVQPRLELRSGWRFRLDPGGDSKGLERRDVADDDWQVLLTGEAWERQGHPDYDGVAWYRRVAVVPDAWRDEDVHVTWGGAADAVTLWINHEEVLHLEGADAFRPVAVRLPAALLGFGRENLVVFRVEDRGGPGGLVGAPVALESGRTTSTHWAARFRPEVLLDDVRWSAGAQEQTFSFEVEGDQGGGDFLDLTARPSGGGGEFEVRLVAPDGETTLARRECSGVARLELPLDRPGRWSVVVDDRRGGEAGGRLRVVLRDS